MKSYEPIGAVLRGLHVLRALNKSGPMTVGELHKSTGIAKPTVVRIIETLQHAGYVGQRDTTLRYAVTARVLQLGSGYNEQHDLLVAATPLLDRFRELVTWPVEIGVFDHDAMVILNTSRRPGFLSVNRQAGSRVPLLRTSLGRAYLGAVPDEQLAAILESLSTKPGPDFELARHPGKLWALIRRVRRNGYGYSDRETISNGRTLAAAIRRGAQPIASVNIVVLASAMPMQDIEAKFGPRIIDLARRISKEIAPN
jgi:IclR family transcriptional regulator, mhp operon transcriptional activator